LSQNKKGEYSVVYFSFDKVKIQNLNYQIPKQLLLTLFNNFIAIKIELARKLKVQQQNYKVMLELRKRYLELKAKAKKVMLAGQMNAYFELLIEMEQLNLILIRVNK